MGWYIPVFITASTASEVATPSITAKAEQDAIRYETGEVIYGNGFLLEALA